MTLAAPVQLHEDLEEFWSFMVGKGWHGSVEVFIIPGKTPPAARWEFHIRAKSKPWRDKA